MPYGLPSRSVRILAWLRLFGSGAPNFAGSRAESGVRRIGTGLFLPGTSLYKDRAVRGRVFAFSRPKRDANSADRTPLYQRIERNLSMAVALSVVVPVKDEAENVAPLAREIALAVGPDSEIIFVDDGSSDRRARGECTDRRDSGWRRPERSERYSAPRRGAEQCGLRRAHAGPHRTALA